MYVYVSVEEEVKWDEETVNGVDANLNLYALSLIATYVYNQQVTGVCFDGL